MRLWCSAALRSYGILFSSFLGLGIEFRKLTQAMSISVDFSGPYPRLKFADKSSYTCAPLLCPLPRVCK